MSAGLIVLAFFVGIIAILLLITLHEVGHFVVAKLAGAYVYEFSVGFGPRIYTHKGKETWFSIRIIPLGGFVSIASDRVDPPKDREEESERIPDSRKMDYLARWKKALFILAGPVMNFAIAIIMISIIFMATLQLTSDMNFAGNRYDDKQIAYNLVLNNLTDEEEKKTFLTNEQTITLTGWEVLLIKNDDYSFDPSVVNGKTTKDIYDQFNSSKNIVIKFSNLNGDLGLKNQPIDNVADYQKITNNEAFIYDKDVNKPATYNKIVYNFIDNFGDKNLKLTSEERNNYYSIIRFSYRSLDPKLSTQQFVPGTSDQYTSFSERPAGQIDKTTQFKYDDKKSSVGIKAPTRYFKNTTAAYGYSWKYFGDQSISILKAFGLLFTGHITQLAGPVGVANQTANLITQAPSFFLYVAGLSANLFVLNLIPIPPLDGYKFFENIVEAILRREVSQKTKIWLYSIGAILFAVLFVVITIKDLVVG